jgi:hypothetical protein
VNGTRFAASRSTVPGSGSDNPTAANVGTANSTAPMLSSCPDRRRSLDELCRYAYAAVTKKLLPPESDVKYLWITCLLRMGYRTTMDAV